MKILNGAIALAATLTLVGTAPASAQLTLATPPECTAFDAFVANGSLGVPYVECGGAFSGNDKNQDVAGWVSSNWGLNVTFAGSTDEEPHGVFTSPYATSGTTGILNFAGTGLSDPFVLSLKAGNKFSLYWFDPAESWTTLTYGTSGTDEIAELSHASVFLTGQPPVQVPEPGSVVLLVTALSAFGFVAVRRREEDEPAA